MTFNTLGLHPDILSAVESQGYTEPTPIQTLAIPVVLKGGDVLARAQTGTGKTAAFTLPMLHRLSQESRGGGKAPIALVLTPTRELAAQVAKSIEDYGQNLSLRSMVIFGGVGLKPQIRRLRQGVDIVIGTPGRLLDLAGQKELDLSRIEILVLDEADRMLDMGFIHDIRKIMRLVPKQRQTLFFSATYTPEIKSLSDTILTKPTLVEVVSQNTATETVAQSVYFLPKAKKRDLLAHLITSESWTQVLVFTKTKHAANRLAKELDKLGIVTAAIHGNKSQSARTRALADFKDYKVQVLVATDIAARGLDIDQLPHVVNFELPHVPEDYVHRIGRTGRAGHEGEAVSLVSDDEVKLLRAIERTIKAKIPVKHNNEFSQQPREDGYSGSSLKGPGQGRYRDKNSRGNQGGYGGSDRKQHGAPGNRQDGYRGNQTRNAGNRQGGYGGSDRKQHGTPGNRQDGYRGNQTGYSSGNRSREDNPQKPGAKPGGYQGGYGSNQARKPGAKSGGYQGGYGAPRSRKPGQSSSGSTRYSRPSNR